MDWTRLGTDWPNAQASRFVDARPHRWHLQVMGTGPRLLLIHGAGGATHSWRDIMPMLAERFEVVAVDLPGQGFSTLSRPMRASLPAMSEDLATLLIQEDLSPDLIIGHSAGAAVALTIAQRSDIACQGVIGLNAALQNFDGIAGWLFPKLAKLLVLNPFTANMFTATAGNQKAVKRLIEGTGSKIDDLGLALYNACIADRGHVNATLRMMSLWNLDRLTRDLPRITTPVLFIAGENDKAVHPDVSHNAAAKMPEADVVVLDGLGHLAHEESPARVIAAMEPMLGRMESSVSPADARHPVRA